jgi:hypothetical protein
VTSHLMFQKIDEASEDEVQSHSMNAFKYRGPCFDFRKPVGKDCFKPNG